MSETAKQADDLKAAECVEAFKPLADAARLTDDERSIILHSLGVEYPRGKRKPKPYRNYYCADTGDARLLALTRKGLMRAGYTINASECQYFHVTEAGAAAVGHKLPKDD